MGDLDHLGVGIRDIVIWLSLVPGVGPRRLERLLSAAGPEALLGAGPAELQRLTGLPRELVDRVVSQRRAVDPSGLGERLEADGLHVITYLDSSYPVTLRSLIGGPAVLFVLGQPEALGAPAVAVVGTRKPSPYGVEVTRAVARDLACAGVTVISGLAVGVDAAAHQGAVDAGGRTVAVLGSGLHRLYPRENAGLAEAIIERGGAVISQFRPETLPNEGTFVTRNRLVAALSRGVVVTQAPEGSGALRTAEFARELGRPVFVVPGPVTSRLHNGCHELLRRGGRAVRSGLDVLEDLGLAPGGPGVTCGSPGACVHPDARRGSDPEEASVLEALGHGETVPFTLLQVRTGLSSERLGAALGLLEVRGLVARLPGHCYARLETSSAPRARSTEDALD